MTRQDAVFEALLIEVKSIQNTAPLTIQIRYHEVSYKRLITPLVQAFKPNTQITDDANALANTLIIDLNIQQDKA